MVVLEPGGGVVGGRHVFGNLQRLQVLLAILAEPPTFRFQLAKKKSDYAEGNYWRKPVTFPCLFLQKCDRAKVSSWHEPVVFLL